jgi:hypothetical protein
MGEWIRMSDRLGLLRLRTQNIFMVIRGGIPIGQCFRGICPWAHTIAP